MTKCDVCGTEMTIRKKKDEEQTISALRMDLDNGKKNAHPEFKRVKKIFGKTKFTICYPCWLKSLGVKVLK